MKRTQTRRRKRHTHGTRTTHTHTPIRENMHQAYTMVARTEALGVWSSTGVTKKVAKPSGGRSAAKTRVIGAADGRPGSGASRFLLTCDGTGARVASWTSHALALTGRRTYEVRPRGIGLWITTASALPDCVGGSQQDSRVEVDVVSCATIVFGETAAAWPYLGDVAERHVETVTLHKLRRRSCQNGHLVGNKSRALLSPISSGRTRAKTRSGTRC